MMRQNWFPHPLSYLCTEHFEEEFVIRHKQKILLTKNAVPTIFIRKPRRSSKQTKMENLLEPKKPRMSLSEMLWKEAQLNCPKLKLAFVAPLTDVGDVYVGPDPLMKYYEVEDVYPVPIKFKRQPILPPEPPVGEHSYSLPSSDSQVKVRVQRLLSSNVELQRRLQRTTVQLHRTRKSLAVYQKKESKKNTEKKEEVTGPTAPNRLLGEILQVLNSNVKKSNNKVILRPKSYSDSMKEFVLTLYKKSPEAYHYIRLAFDNALPQECTVRRWNKSSEVDKEKEIKIEIKEERTEDVK